MDLLFVLPQLNVHSVKSLLTRSDMLVSKSISSNQIDNNVEIHCPAINNIYLADRMLMIMIMMVSLWTFIQLPRCNHSLPLQQASDTLTAACWPEI